MAIYATGCLCCLSLAGTSCATGEEPVYDNPLRTSAGDTVRLADPFVYESDGLYYMTGTTASAEASGFDYYVSSDLVAWEYGGPLFRKSPAHFGAGAFWAPEVERYEGRFYMTYSCLEPERGVLLSCLAVSDRPEGPFEELYTPWFDLGFSAIDCDIFVDDDPQHTPYLYFSKNGNRDGYAFGENWVVRLKKDLSGFDGEPRLVSRASQPWELVNRERNRCNEGAFVFKRAGVYYMTYSANDTGYSDYGVGVAMAPRPLGPWTKSEDNPLMTTDLARGISSPGHGCVVDLPDGESYFFYHRHADPHGSKPSFDRVVCMDRLFFDGDGALRTDGPSSEPRRKPGLRREDGSRPE